MVESPCFYFGLIDRINVILSAISFVFIKEREIWSFCVSVFTCEVQYRLYSYLPHGE